MSPGRSVLHVTECYAGGVSRAIETIVDLKDEIEHHLLWSGDEEPTPSDYASVREMPRAPWSAIASVRRAVTEVRPSVVHAHSSWAGVFTRLAGLDVPVVYEPHCYKFDDPAQPWPLRTAYHLAERLLVSRAQTTVVLSPHERALAESLGRGVPTHFLPNVASVVPSEAHPATGYAMERTVFMIGRLSPQKDPDYFAEVAERVADSASDVRFVWIGDGEPEKRERLARAGVEVAGWLSGEEMAAVLSRPGLYLHVARYEGFPLSILDAAIFEHPVAARAIPAFDGFDIPSAESPEQVAHLVMQILEDDGAREQAISAARHLNETMTLDAQRRALDDLYSSI